MSSPEKRAGTAPKVEPGPNLGRPLARGFYRRPSAELAPELLNKILVAGSGDALCAGRIVEVEAYDMTDAASHSAAGKTDRNAVMFGPPGHLYVYFSYGMHWCVNAVCEAEGHGAACLIRALEPICGQELMFARRAKARRERDLCSGPAKLAQALGLDRQHDGVDLTASRSLVTLRSDGVEPPECPAISPRIGITKAVETLWRWSVAANEHVSKAPRAR